MKLLLDNLFFLGEIISLVGVAWGAWMVTRYSLCGIVFPVRKCSVSPMTLTVSLTQPFRRMARV